MACPIGSIRKKKTKKAKKCEVWLPNFGETTANLAKLRRTCIFGRFGEITPRRLWHICGLFILEGSVHWLRVIRWIVLVVAENR